MQKCVLAFIAFVLLVGCSSKENSKLNESDLKEITNSIANPIIVESTKSESIQSTVDINKIKKTVNQHQAKLSELNQKINSLAGGDKDGSRYLLNEIFETCKTQEELYDVGRIAYSQGKSWLSFIISTNIYATIPEGFDKQCVLTDILLATDSLKRFEQNIEWCKIAISAYPNTRGIGQVAFSKIAHSYFALGDYKRAEENHRKLYALDKSTHSCMNIAKCCIEQNKYDEALQILNDGIEKSDGKSWQSSLIMDRERLLELINKNEKK